MKAIGSGEINPALTPAEKIVVEAQIHPMIKALNREIIEGAVIKSYGEILAIKGLKDVPVEDQDFFIDYVSKTLKESFSTYRISDINNAAEMWARGELFGDKDLNVLSAENFFKALFRYNDMVRKEAIHKQKQYEEKLEKEKTEEKIIQDRQKFESAILKIYDAFPKGYKQRTKGSMAAMYRYLDGKGLIKLPNSRKHEILAGIKRIKERTKLFPKNPFSIISNEELAQYRALYEVFESWKEFDYDLKSEFDLDLKDKRK